MLGCFQGAELQGVELITEFSALLCLTALICGKLRAEVFRFFYLCFERDKL